VQVIKNGLFLVLHSRPLSFLLMEEEGRGRKYLLLPDTSCPGAIIVALQSDYLNPAGGRVLYRRTYKTTPPRKTYHDS